MQRKQSNFMLISSCALFLVGGEGWIDAPEVGRRSQCRLHEIGEAKDP